MSRYRSNFFPPPPTTLFHVPPSSLPTPDFSIPPPPVRHVIQQRDLMWLNAWLGEKQLAQSKIDNPTKSKLSNICDSRQLICDADALLQELRDIMENLQRHSQCNELTWNTMVASIDTKKEQLADLTNTTEDSDFVSRCRRALMLRMDKRKAKKRQRLEWRGLRHSQMDKRQALHLKIDEQLSKRRDALERDKREADTKEEADAVLCEVRLKQSEGRRRLQLFDSLIKLRQVRARAAADKGLRPAAHEDTRFWKIIEKLGLMWRCQLKSYDAEERTLRVMLEEEAVVRHKISRRVDPLSEWERLLFGSVPGSDDLEFALLNRANVDPLELVRTRANWDELVVDSSSVTASAPPLGWIVPTAPTSKEWSEFLQPACEASV